MQRRTLLATVGAGAAAGLAGCASALGFGDDSPCSDTACEIGMTRNAFAPDVYEATVGETVVWRNTSSANHTVTAYGDSIPDDAAYFASGGYESEAAAREAWENFGGRLFPEDTFEHTFEVPGDYTYLCIPHERGGMTGTIVVSE